MRIDAEVITAGFNDWLACSRSPAVTAIVFSLLELFECFHIYFVKFAASYYDYFIDFRNESVDLAYSSLTCKVDITMHSGLIPPPFIGDSTAIASNVLVY